jgi:urocanate reductase
VASSGLAVGVLKGSAEASVRKLPSKWDEEVDVLIVGSGFAGMAAAAEAASRCGKVTIIEPMPILGPNSYRKPDLVNLK